MTRLPLAALILLLLAAAPARDRIPEAIPAGDPARCIPIAQIRQSLVRSDDVIDFVMLGRRVYRNTLPGGCPGLGFERRFAYTTSLSQLCSTDIVTVITTAPVMRGASCGLGVFQPVTLPGADRSTWR